MRALTGRRATAAPWAALLLCACSAPSPEPLPLTIGVHEVQLIAPAGWEHLDHGREQRFENGLAQISLADIGPVNREGFQREIVHARELYRQGQLEDARARLGTLHLRPSFPSERRWRSFVVPWNGIRRAGLGRRPLGPQAVESAYTEVLAEIGALPRPEMTTLAASVLKQLGHDERRDVARQEAMAIGGRDALLVDTWDRLNHTGRKRHVFVLNEGNLLVARMELGRFSEMEPVFDALVASLGFRSEL